MADILRQVFAFLDSSTLFTIVPSVCKLWHKIATDPQLWTPRLPQQVVAVAASHATITAKADSSDSQYNNCHRQLPLSLPLLHHATYSKNLLRNPSFLLSQNSDVRRLVRVRPAGWVSIPGSRGAAKSSKSVPSIISTEQRRLAWVTARSTGPEAMTWQCLAAGTPTQPAPPAPSSYPSYSSSISQQLQGWLKGLTTSAVSKAAALATAGGALVSDKTSQQPQRQQDIITCLATGSSWGEVVQVVDLFEELVMRGLAPSLAAALLDSGALALGLSVWATAATSDTNSQARSSGSSSSSDEELDSSSSSNSSSLRYGSHLQRQGQGCAVLHVALMLDDGQVPLKTFQTFVRRESSHHFVSQRVKLTSGGWQRYTYFMSACPRGCRRAVVLLRGRGSGMQQQQSNSSGSGVRFASAELKFVPQSQAQSWQEGSTILT